MAKKTYHNVNGTTWSSFDKNNKPDLSKEFPIRDREYLISDLYTMYDLKMIELDKFKSIIALITANPEDAVLGMMIVKKLKRDTKYRLFLKLNRRLPFARSISDEKLTIYNTCPYCKLVHKDVQNGKTSSYCPNKQHQGALLSGSNPLFALLKTDPEDSLFIAAARSIQQTLKR